jgi:NAD(P)H-flavin reductase
MYTLRTKENLGPDVVQYTVDAPLVAEHCQPGQFVIVRVSDHGERIPLTVADADAKKGTITLVVQAVGKTTRELAMLNPGDALHDVAGPLGKPTHIEKYGAVLCIAGGIGAAPLLPIARAMKAAGNRVVTILGARAKDLIILEEDLRAASDELLVTTDDGTYGTRGKVTDALQMLVDRCVHIDQAIVIGPPLMMKFVAMMTKNLRIPTIASLNPVMIDGTGMCGGCRVTVGGHLRFACVDGPEFDAHEVDWESMIRRLGTYRLAEQAAAERFDHTCRVGLHESEST